MRVVCTGPEVIQLGQVSSPWVWWEGVKAIYGGSFQRDLWKVYQEFVEFIE